MRFRVSLPIALLTLALTAAAGFAATVTPPRPGQIGVSVQGGYGSLLDVGGVGSEFGDGPTFAVRLRYRMRYERGIGLSFESQRLADRLERPYDPSHPDSTTFPDKLEVTLSGADFYQFFGTRTPTVKMISIGGGLVQQRVKLNSGETELSGTFSGDGLYLSGGFGVERYFYRGFALDISTRYYAMFRDGKVGHNLQAAIGIIGYAGY
jgi:hypothetical protein